MSPDRSAELAKSALESAGIDAMIQSDSAGGMRPHLAWASGGFKILVRDEDTAARDVLEPSVETGVDHEASSRWNRGLSAGRVFRLSAAEPSPDLHGERNDSQYEYKMHQRNEWVAKHFLLSECKQY